MLFTKTPKPVRMVLAYVVLGQVFNIEVGDAWLSQGMDIYTIRSGKQLKTGRIIKLQ